MKTIDKLLRQASGADKHWSMLAFVDHLHDCWEARYSFWNGERRTGERHKGISCHATCEDAVAAIEDAREAFPHRLTSTSIVIDDIDVGGVVDGETS